MSASVLSKEDVTHELAYAGLVFVAFELIKALIVKPIRDFYSHTTFGPGVPFTTYERDVLARAPGKNREFEAALYYLRDFMKAIDADDMDAIQALRDHRNSLAHNLAAQLETLDVSNYVNLLERTTKALFKLSNYCTYMEIGADPEFQAKGIDWNTAVGREYLLLQETIRKARIL